MSGIGLKDVQGVYSGPDGRLWELIMGEQIHIGGFKSSMDLATRAGNRAALVARFDQTQQSGIAARIVAHKSAHAGALLYQALHQVADATERRRLLQDLADRFILDVLEDPDVLNKTETRLRLLTWLIANDKLELRFAFPRHVPDAGIYQRRHAPAGACSAAGYL